MIVNQLQWGLLESKLDYYSQLQLLYLYVTALISENQT